ncbi:MAG: hypothetical protein OK457_00480 [Thaumarchaeota archaeon]|nr:hypothetical protein [Nitrososphaerota archaeon]
MADDMAVSYSVGFLESWIARAGAITLREPTNGDRIHGGANNVDAALTHLKIVEDAYNDYRRSILAYKATINQLKNQLDVASSI